MARKLLIIEDDATTRAFVGNVLRSDFDIVREAADGAAGLALAEEDAPELVLLDLALSGMDGLEVCRRMRESASLKDTPIVVLTASADEATVAAAFSAGATDYLVKPFAPSQLRTRARIWRLRGGDARGNRPPSGLVTPIPRPTCNWGFRDDPRRPSCTRLSEVWDEQTARWLCAEHASALDGRRAQLTNPHPPG